MKITCESELMKNHKHAQVMSPASKFQALQTNEGHSLFFSIGTDGVFYLSKEATGDVNGWARADLSSHLSASKVVAKTFEVGQNNETGTIDMALAVTVDGKDYLYVSLNNSNSDTSWSSALAWVALPYDDPAHVYPSVVIADIFMPKGRSGGLLVVDILKDPASTQNFVFRYFIDPAKSFSGAAWNPHDLSASLESGSISSVVGRRANDHVDGIYTLGTIKGEVELIFTPLYSYFSHGTAPTPVRLTVPPLASAIAVAPQADGSTNLFVAADKALYFFPSDQQKEPNPAVKIVDNDLFAGVQSLHADVQAGQVFVWGLNQPGNFFYLKCAVGQEQVATAWTYPVPILSGVQQLAPYANKNSGHSVVFAHLQEQKVIQLSQDPATAIWQQRSILLPATDMKDVLEYNSFSSHVQVKDDNNLSLGKVVTLTLTSFSPVGIYVNNLYHKLSDTVGTDIDTDITGALTIVQETQALSAVCYHVTEKTSGAKIDINPMAKMNDKIAAIQTGTDLGKLNVTNEDGSTKPLLPAGTPDDQRDATAGALKQFATINSKLPADGSKTAPAAKPAALRATAFTASTETVWGISYDKQGWTYHEGQPAVQKLGLKLDNSTNRLHFAASAVQVGDAVTYIETVAEDIWNWLKKAWESVTKFFVQLVDDIYHFVLEIAGEVYRFILDCVSAVVHAVEFVFNKIKVFFEDLIKWLGFLFQWGDIVRTHNVIKNVLKQYAAASIAGIQTCKQEIIDQFTQLETNLNNWAGLPQVNEKVGDLTPSSPTPGQDSPQARYGIYHTQSNMDNANSNYAPKNPVSSAAADMLQTLLALVTKEEKAFDDAIDQIKDTIENLATLTFTEIVKRIAGIIGGIILKTAENVITTAMDIFAEVLEGVMDVLDAPLDIPVLSWLYQKVAGNPLSILDLICLVVAIPATIIYKLAFEAAPFPDNEVTTSLSNAADFATIQKICVGESLQHPAALQATRAMAVSPGVPTATYNTLVVVGNSMAFAGSIILSIVNIVKYNLPKNGFASALGGLSYLPFIGPDIMIAIPSPAQPYKWYKGMNSIVTTIATIKTMVDISLYKKTDIVPDTPKGFINGWGQVSPWMEALINLVWQVPTTFFYTDLPTPKLNDKLNLSAGTLFDLGGVLAPFIDKTKGIPQWVLLGLASLCNLSYGSLCLAQSVDNQ